MVNKFFQFNVYYSFYKFEYIGIDILNSSDPFFNDICYTYTDGSSDVILTDRINEIYQNYSLCDSGCEYEGLNATTGTVSCSCNVTSEDSDDDDDTASNLKSIFLSLFSDSTIGVIQCYKNVFTYSKKSNIGFWIFLVLVIGHIPLYVWFFMKGNSKIKSYIIGERDILRYSSTSKLYTLNIYFELGIIFYTRKYKKLHEILGDIFPIITVFEFPPIESFK